MARPRWTGNRTADIAILAAAIFLSLPLLKAALSGIAMFFSIEAATAINWFYLIIPNPAEGLYAVIHVATISVLAALLIIVLSRRQSVSSAVARRSVPRYLLTTLTGFTLYTTAIVIGAALYSELGPRLSLLRWRVESWGEPLYFGPIDATWVRAVGVGLRGAFEELVAVAFVVLLARRFKVSMTWAAVTSVLFRLAFHVYYGLGATLIFVTLWATFAVLFDIKTHSVLPLWLAHFVHNLTTINYSPPAGDYYAPEAPYMRWWAMTGEPYLALIGIILAAALTIRFFTRPPLPATHSPSAQRRNPRRARRPGPVRSRRAGRNDHHYCKVGMIYVDIFDR